jgi:hypothetical protein
MASARLVQISGFGSSAPAVTAWLIRHPRYRLHFTQTNGSWLNQVERWFALLAGA